MEGTYSSNELPSASYHRVAFAGIQEEHTVPHSSPKATININVIIIPKIIKAIVMIPIVLQSLAK
jgi:hypothetical protein